MKLQTQALLWIVLLAGQALGAEAPPDGKLYEEIGYLKAKAETLAEAIASQREQLEKLYAAIRLREAELARRAAAAKPE